jgi:hypothetical protein
VIDVGPKVHQEQNRIDEGEQLDGGKQPQEGPQARCGEIHVLSLGSGVEKCQTG